MINSMNPEGKLYNRPVPANMHVDPHGLVDSWLAAAEDWLLANDGSEALTSREAFEGIEQLGRLTRCSPGLIEQLGGQAIVTQLQATVLDPANQTIFSRALTFPDLDAWRTQAQAAWDNDAEDLALVRRLLEDLDAADFVLWFCERIAADEPLPGWDAFQEKLSRCHLWLDRYAALFAIGEPYIRAVGLTISEDGDVPDPTGSLMLSAAKYIRLLDECEQAWRSLEPQGGWGFLLDQPPLGTLKLDYRVPQLAHAAGAQAPFVAPRRPLVWEDPAGQYQALLFLPAYIAPGTDVSVELIFGTGAEFAEPAVALVGMAVRLGGTQATIGNATLQGLPTVLAYLSLNQIVECKEEQVSLLVGETPWELR